jgi:Ca2+-binding RTX toxin-like protein
MRKLVPAALIGGLALFAAASDALAGQIVEAAGGQIKVNGKAVAVPVAVNKGDVVETGSATATFRSDAGDVITLDRNTVAKGEGTEGGIEYLFVKSGVATGNLSEKTTLGVAASWATAPKGMRTEVRVEAPADRAASEGRFRTISGGTWLRNDDYTTWLPAQHSVTLWRDATKKGSMCFRTSQQNTGKVDVVRTVAGGNIRVIVPRAASGCVEDFKGNKTKISNDFTSNKQEKVRVETEFASSSTAEIGPGGYAVIDNQTGAIETFEETFDEVFGEEIPQYDPVEDASDASATRKKKR